MNEENLIRGYVLTTIGVYELQSKNLKQQKVLQWY